MPDIIDIEDEDEPRVFGDCPECGARAFQELSYRGTFQGVQLDDDGEPDNWDSFDYGDDVWVYGVECTSCRNTWPTYEDLRKAMRGEEHATGYLPDVQVFAAPVVWVVLRIDTGDIEADVFTNEAAADEHVRALREANPDSGVELIIREETTSHVAWSPEVGA